MALPNMNPTQFATAADAAAWARANIGAISDGLDMLVAVSGAFANDATLPAATKAQWAAINTAAAAAIATKPT